MSSPDSSTINFEDKLSYRLKFLVLAEFIESLSFSGTRFLLNQLLKTGYGLEVHQAKSLVHLSTGLTCLGSLLGAFVSDRYLSCYKTILYSLILYTIGTFLQGFFSINNLLAPYGRLPIWGFILACVFIAIGSGGIRPCFLAFNGDQFLPHQQKSMDRFFSFLFTIVSIGSIPVIYFVPLIKNSVHCFGKECYPLAYAIATIFIVLSLLFFIAGRNRYMKKTIVKTTILWNIVKSKQLSDFDKNALDQLNQFKRVILFAFCLSFHFLLDEQCLTEWMNQFERMDKQILGFYIPTEASSMISAILNIFFIPILSLFVYPYFERRGLNIIPIYRILIGYLCIILSFMTSTSLEYYVQYYSINAVTQYGIIVECSGCLNGSWQIPQLFLAALANSFILPSLGLFLYQNVSSQFKCLASSLSLVSVFMANLMILVLEYPFHYMPTATSRQWAYIAISTLGYFVSILMTKKWFLQPHHYDETDIENQNVVEALPLKE